MKTTTVDSSSSTMVTTAMVSVMEEVHVVLEIFVRACLLALDVGARDFEPTVRVMDRGTSLGSSLDKVFPSTFLVGEYIASFILEVRGLSPTS